MRAPGLTFTESARRRWFAAKHHYGILALGFTPEYVGRLAEHIGMVDGYPAAFCLGTKIYLIPPNSQPVPSMNLIRCLLDSVLVR